MGCNCEQKKRILEKLAGQDISRRTVYMDYNATTPVLPECLGAFERSCRNNWGNPSNCHPAGARAWEELEDHRKTIAGFFRSAPEEIFFCSSGSQALAAGIAGIAEIAGLDSGAVFFITTATEHSAVLGNITALPAERYAVLGVDGNGRIVPGELEALLAGRKKAGGRTVLVFSPVNHETGALQDLREIHALARRYGALVFFDAVQAAARLSPEDWRPWCDLFAASSHKLYAPKGCGVLGVSGGPQGLESLGFRPARFGGGQEGGIFPGTENTPGIAAFAAAAARLSVSHREDLRVLENLTREGLGILRGVPGNIILESPETRAPGILCVSFPEVENMKAFMDFLHSRLICVSRFSACTDDQEEASAILTAMGRPRRRAERSLRISTGLFSRREDYFALAAAVKDYRPVR